MAIKDDNQPTALGAAMANAGVKSNNSNQADTQQSSNTSTDQGFTNTGTGNNGKMSFSSMGMGLAAPIPLSNTSETLGKFQRAIQEVIDSYKQDTAAVQTTLIPVDRHDGAIGVPISYLIVAVQLTKNREAGVGYLPLIIEGSIDPIPVTEEYVAGAPGGKVQVLRTAGDADVPAVREKIHKIVMARFQTDKAYPAIGMVVPRDFTDNLNDPLALKNLASRASYAAAIALQTQLGTKPLNLADYIGGADTLQARLSLDSRPVMNLFKQPVRSDMKVTVVSEPVAKQQVPGFSATGGTEIANTSAFVNVIYQPKNVAQSIPGFSSMTQPSPDMYMKYLARIVLTDLRAERIQTIGGQLLALVSAISLRNNDLWKAAFLPRRDIDPNQLDLRDVGVLNQEVNFGGDPNVPGPVMDIKADSFGTPQLMTFLRAIFHPGVVFAVDVSLRGPDTSYNGVLAAADDGDAGAIAAIKNAANALTNGEFLKIFPANGEITLKKGENIHLGYYRAANGEVRDLRDVDDYLTIMALFGKSAPNLVRDYSDSYLKTAYPEAQRMAGRLEVLKQAAPNLVVTSTARRVTFAGVFIDSLVQAVEKVGAAMPITGNAYLDTGTADRAVGDFSSGLTSAASSVLFTRAPVGGQANNSAPGNQFAGIWRP